MRFFFTAFIIIVGILRDEKSLEQANELLYRLNADFPRDTKCLNREEYEFRNMLTVSRLITHCALSRKESRGAHFRTDYPNSDEKCVHSYITKEEDNIIKSFS